MATRRRLSASLGLHHTVGSRCPGFFCCPHCHRRYEEVKVQFEHTKVNLARQKTEFEGTLSRLKAKHTLEMSNQQTEFEGTLSRLKAKHTLEMSNQQTEFEGKLSRLKVKLKAKLNHLKVGRDCHEDVVLEVQGREIRAHKIILADKSQVFRKMFGSGMLENHTGKVQMVGASHAVIDAVVNFCYTGEICFVETVPLDEVLEVAHMYDIQHLKNICEFKLCRRISIGNLPQLLKLSRTFAARNLEEQAGKFFKEHFDELKDKVFESLETPTVSKLVSRVSMPVENHVRRTRAVTSEKFTSEEAGGGERE